MPGIFITRGSALRIPAGGLTLRLDGGPVPPVQIDLRLDIWDRWLAIAGSEVVEAEVAHARLLEAIAQEEDAAKSQALESEFNAALIAIAATGFAVDAFYASVKERIGLSPDTEASWVKNRTARHARVVEVFKLAFGIGPKSQEQLRDFLKLLFQFRSWAVHPPNDWRTPAYHNDLDAGVEWRFLAFSAENARNAFDNAASLFRQALEIPRPGLEELWEWVPSATALLNQALDEDAQA